MTLFKYISSVMQLYYEKVHILIQNALSPISIIFLYSVQYELCYYLYFKSIARYSKIDNTLFKWRRAILVSVIIGAESNLQASYLIYI